MISKNKTDLEEAAKKIIKETQEWFKNNKLTLNPTKTRAINFNTKMDITIKINNENIQQIKIKNTN